MILLQPVHLLLILSLVTLSNPLVVNSFGSFSFRQLTNHDKTNPKSKTHALISQLLSIPLIPPSYDVSDSNRLLSTSPTSQTSQSSQSSQSSLLSSPKTKEITTKRSKSSINSITSINGINEINGMNSIDSLTSISSGVINPPYHIFNSINTPNSTDPNGKKRKGGGNNLISLLGVLGSLFVLIGLLLCFAKRRMGDPDRPLSLIKEEQIFSEHVEKYRLLYIRNLRMEQMEVKAAKQRAMSTLGVLKSHKNDYESGNESDGDGCKLTPQSSYTSSQQTTPIHQSIQVIQPRTNNNTNNTNNIITKLSEKLANMEDGATRHSTLILPPLNLADNDNADNNNNNNISKESPMDMNMGGISSLLESVEDVNKNAMKNKINKGTQLQPKRVASESVVNSTVSESSGRDIVLRVASVASGGVMSDTDYDDDDDESACNNSSAGNGGNNIGIGIGVGSSNSGYNAYLSPKLKQGSTEPITPQMPVISELKGLSVGVEDTPAQSDIEAYDEMNRVLNEAENRNNRHSIKKTIYYGNMAEIAPDGINGDRLYGPK